MRRLLLLGCSVLFAGALLPGQTTGALEGTVVDPSGAAVAQSRIRIVEEATAAERVLEATTAGRFAARGLLPGLYRVEASMPGFQTRVRSGIEVAAGRTVQVRLELAIGEQSQTVEVRADAPVLSTSASDWGGSIEAGKLEELPLAGRDLFDLVDQQPGATVALNAQNNLVNGPGVQIAVNGNRPAQNSYLLDGIYINDATNSAPASAGGICSASRDSRNSTSSPAPSRPNTGVRRVG